MTRFIALLAIVSGIVLTWPAKADDTAKWCVANTDKPLELIESVKAQGFPTRELDATNTLIFLSIVRENEYIAGVPNLPGARMTLLINPGVLVWGLIFKDDKWCARIQLPWAEYQAVLKAMQPKNI